MIDLPKIAHTPPRIRDRDKGLNEKNFGEYRQNYHKEIKEVIMNRTLAELAAEFEKTQAERPVTQRFLEAFMKVHEDESGWLVRHLGDGRFRVLRLEELHDPYIIAMSTSGSLVRVSDWSPFGCDVFTNGQDPEVYMMYKDLWLEI